MNAIIPTPEQELILAEAKSKDSLLISALAGAAKTTTLCLLAKRLPLVPTLCVAFNKRTAEEMAKRMPSHVQCQTLNSAGHRVWAATIGKRLTLDSDKSYSTLSDFVSKLPQDQQKDVRENFAGVLRAVRLAKSAGYIPDRFASMGKRLVTAEELEQMLIQQLDMELSFENFALIDRVLEHSIGEAYAGRIDFDDQIYMSTLFGGAYPKFPIVMVDESQDLSPLNHESVTKMVAPGGRLIAVGDPNQAIYGFRGAHHSSMEELCSRFSMKSLELSTSFRCPKAVVRRAHWRVPHMAYPDWAIEGKVETLEEWSADSVPDGAAILCRNNAPIFSCAMQLIRAGRGVKIVGSDIGASLVKILEKLGPGDTKQEAVYRAVKSWEVAQLAKVHETRHAAVHDRAQCLLVFAEFGQTLDAAIAYAKHLFSSSGPIQLMTGHKSKGAEWDTVFHLDPWRVPSKWAKVAAENGDDSQLQQEYNLKYVIETRSKKELFLVNLDDFR